MTWDIGVMIGLGINVLAVTAGYGALRNQVSEVQRKVDVLFGKLSEVERRMAMLGERIARMEGKVNNGGGAWIKHGQ